MSRKFAFLVGINDYPGSGNDLRGCINDLDDMADTLKSVYRWPITSFVSLRNKSANRDNIVTGLQYVMMEAQDGDEVLFHYSGHGSQVADISGDESDKLDEILVPYDYERNLSDPLSDDVLRQVFSLKKPGVNLTVILDSCHSGSGTRVPDIRPKFIPWPIQQTIPEGLPINRIGVKQVQFGPTAENMNHVLLAGCRANQTSADAYMQEQKKYNGAWTWGLTRAMKELGPATQTHDVFARAQFFVRQAKFDQVPCLEGRKALRDRPFLGGPAK